MTTTAGMDYRMRRSILKDLCMQQAWRCFWCGELMDNADPKSPQYRTLEHVIPAAGGGKKAQDRTNFRAACRGCNEMRGEFHGIRRCNSALAQDVERLKAMVTKAQESLHKNVERQKVTMAGRCYWCKLRFHVKEWLHKRRARKAIA